MNEKKKLQPKVRFREFTGENAPNWEQRKLGDMASIGSGRDYKHLSSGNIPVYGTGGYMLSVNEYLSDKDAIGIGRKGTIDKPYILNAPFWTVDTLFFVVPKNQVDLQYLFSVFQKIYWKKYDESTGVPSLSKQSINNITIYSAFYEEQKRIGKFVGKLEDLITLHQRKLEQLEQLKNTLLSKMFPKSGTNIPEIRFSGFTDAWKQRKLSQILLERNQQSIQTDEYPLVSFTVENGVTPKTERYDREQLVTGDKDKKKYKITKYDDIVYNPANLKFGAISRNKYGNAVFSPIYVTFEVNKNDYLPSFIEYYVIRWDFINYALRFQQGTVYERQSVNVADFLKLRFCSPDKAYQGKLSSLFIIIDDYIAIHQRKPLADLFNNFS